MNQCRECGKGYCPSRVRKVFGGLRPGYCSPQCFTADAMRTAEKKIDDDARVRAMEIIDALTANDVIPAEPMGDPEKFATAVSIVEPFLKV